MPIIQKKVELDSKVIVLRLNPIVFVLFQPTMHECDGLCK